MFKLQLLRSVLAVASIFTISSASVQTQNLGHLNLQPGFALKLYSSSLRGPDGYHLRPQYFKERDFLKDSKLIAQWANVIDITTTWVAYVNNNLFDFLVDPTLTDFVIEIRGYVKAPQTGTFSVNADMQGGFYCNPELSRTYVAGYWIIKDSVSLNDTSDGFVCSYSAGDSNYKTFTFENDCTDYNSCYKDDDIFTNVANVTENQYYPVVFYTYLSGNNIVALWKLKFGDYFQQYLDDIAFYDPQDDFEADDESLNSGFPDACPHFHEEVFTATTFVQMNATDDYNCPPPPSSSSILPPPSSSIFSPSTSSSVEATLSDLSHSVTSSASESNTSTFPSSITPSSVATPTSITSSSGSSTSSADPSSSIFTKKKL